MPQQALGTSSRVLPGFYGKVPTYGDFVSRRLPRSFLDPWDHWLQAGLLKSQEQLGQEWLGYYLTSPLWRFALSPNVAGAGAWLGVLMPSVDRAGRYFPLTLAATLPGPALFVNLFAELNSWFQGAEALVLSCLEETFELGVFDEQVQQLGSPPISRDPELDPSSKPPSSPHQGWRYNLASPEALPAHYPDVIQELLRACLGPYSLWWSAGSEHINPSWFLCQGLPVVEGFSALLDGHWAQWGWQDQSR